MGLVITHPEPRNTRKPSRKPAWPCIFHGLVCCWLPRCTKGSPDTTLCSTKMVLRSLHPALDETFASHILNKGRNVHFRSPFTATHIDANNKAFSVLVDRIIVSRVFVAGGDVSAINSETTPDRRTHRASEHAGCGPCKQRIS